MYASLGPLFHRALMECTTPILRFVKASIICKGIVSTSSEEMQLLLHCQILRLFCTVSMAGASGLDS